MIIYVFRKRSLIEDKSFQANSMLDALQQASNYWFNGEIVHEYVMDRNSVVTLLSNSSSSNVIGSLYHFHTSGAII